MEIILGRHGRLRDATFQAMNTAIKRLIDPGIVTQLDGGGRDRLFNAHDVIELFDPGRTARSVP